ncbi:MAG: RNA-binding protein [Planctomycetes bacterium]|nr:RNA-binding protein [Planctomycetota bacterium]
MAQKVYVGNIPFTCTEDDLRGLFSRYGEVRSVNVIADRETGRPRGFAFVEMESADEAIRNLDGTEFGGRSLKVNLAREREPGGGGGGGRDRGPRGGGGRRW